MRRCRLRPASSRARIVNIATSAVPYLALCVAMYLMLGVSPLLVVALVVPTAGFLVRVFVVFHDCTHGSLLPSRRANTWVGTVLGLFVLSPFRRWRHDHAGHHATSGDLDRRGIGDVPTLTVAEYQARSRRGRLAYRLLRHPLVMFGLGPAIAMFIGPRSWRGRTVVDAQQRARDRRGSGVIGGALCWLIGWKDLLIVWAPAALLAGSIGMWLFYVQHQFDGAYWQRHGEWTYAEAALRGSSYLKLPNCCGSSQPTSVCIMSITSTPESRTTTCSAPTMPTPSSPASPRSPSETVFVPSSSNSGMRSKASC